MRRGVGLLVLSGLLVTVLAGCGATPAATVPPPTQTAWIIIVTATARPESAASVQASETPGMTTAAPTRTPAGGQAVATSTERPVETPGTAAEATETPELPEATNTPAPEKPTNTPEVVTLKYPAPVLLDPPENYHVSYNSTVVFKWSSVGELAEDEYYAIEFYRAPRTGLQDYGDSFFTKAPEFLWQGADKDPFHPPEVQGPVVVDWWVRVVRKTGETMSGKPIGIDISLPSDRWTLVLDPKPAGE